MELRPVTFKYPAHPLCPGVRQTRLCRRPHLSSSVALTASGSVTNQGTLAATNGGQIVLIGTSLSSTAGDRVERDDEV